MGSHIFRILGVRKLGYCRDMKIENLHQIKFMDDLVKRLYKVDA